MRNRTETNGDGSTEPELQEAKALSEAAKVRELWRLKAWADPNVNLDTGCWNRQKSLVLDLALHDYVDVSKVSKQSVSLEEFCSRYSGLNESLRNSIYRQLEVKKYLDEHPEILELESQFVWPEAKDTFLNFRVLDEIGRGALARVYLCEQLHLGLRSAVVKIELGRRLHEPALLGKLRHPNIVPINWADYDPTTDASYLCMPFLGRSTLLDLLKYAFHGGLPVKSEVIAEASKLWLKDRDYSIIDQAAISKNIRLGNTYLDGITAILIQLVEALSYSHSQQVIHGDIKPTNIILSPNGTPYLIDFNLGRERNDMQAPDGGTLHYMAPEQLKCIASREFRKVPTSSISTDVYAFGALSYELLTGKPPFEIPKEFSKRQEIAAALMAMQKSGCKSISEINPDVNAQLASLIVSCLNYQPQHRPSTMGEVLKELSTHVGRIASVRRYVRKYPQRVAAGVIVALGISASPYLVHAFQPTLVERAESAKRDGNFKAAVNFLDSMLVAEPSHVQARLDRAKCNLELGDFRTAYQDLDQLAITEDDPETMAYFGYCLNLMGNHNAALEWHRKAIEHGLVTSGLLNNLGVSLMLHTDHASRESRLTESSDNLDRAMTMRPDSITIRINILQCMVQRLENNLDIDADKAASHAAWFEQNQHVPSRAWTSIFALFDTMANHGIAARMTALGYLRRAIEQGDAFSAEQLKHDPMFAAYRTLPDYDRLLAAARKNRAGYKITPLKRFLDPEKSQ